MSLTNLISIGENVRKHILKEEEFSNIEQHIFEEYPILRRTAIECMCNLIVQKEIIKYFIRENNRIKLLILLCSEDDEL
ncbi:unnamed protein product [Rotaria sordida]|uniref:Uncharacterized protein n=1 Tax=Rotaria sordida TaxID=392033 RepID=A0A815QMT4_9BILA|nr:unnamed protein product [Rotaria sordida]CAF1464183.1 unnamed protein product [Rotaria sordida]